LKDIKAVETWIERMEVFKGLHRIDDQAMLDGTLMVVEDQNGLNEKFATLAMATHNTITEFMAAAKTAANWYIRSYREKQREVRKYSVNMVDQKLTPISKSLNRQQNLTLAYKVQPLSPTPKARTFRRSPPQSPKENRYKNEKSRTPSPPQNLCYSCNRPGHIARNCRLRRNPKWISDNLEKIVERMDELTKRIQAVSGSASVETKKRVTSTLGRRKPPLVISSFFINGSIPGVEGIIRGHKVNVVLDTGCGGVLMSSECANNIGILPKLPKVGTVLLEGPTGERLDYRGDTCCDLVLAGKKVRVKCRVVGRLSADILLGSPFFEEHKA
ncbi:hypothetical protein B4U79_19248, partial [Dinothrombium tinctorium]